MCAAKETEAILTIEEHSVIGGLGSEVAAAVMEADRGHVHHLLLRSGWSIREVLFTLYAAAVGLGALALWTREASSTTRRGVWLVLLMGSLLALRLLERRVERRERSASTEAGAGPTVPAPSVSTPPDAVRAVPPETQGRS